MSDLNQFNESLVRMREHEHYLRLTNYRDSAINDHQHKQTVLLGYYKIMNLINRRLVRTSNQVVAQ